MRNKGLKIRVAALALAILTLASCCLSLFGCGEEADDREITVVCTVFPVYDWVRQVVGEVEGVKVTLLVDNGDPHSFQPTAKDAIAIRTADLVVRAGGADDAFVERLIEKGRGIDLRLMEAEGVTLRCTSISSETEHDHHDEHHGHDHEYDGHIWLSLKNAAACVYAIRDSLSALMPENAESFSANAAAYREKIVKLDEKYSAEISAVSNPRLVVADRFPFVYLTEDYGIAYEAAFEGCTTDAEASFDTVLRLAKRYREWNATAIVQTESGDGRLSEAVSNEAKMGYKNIRLNSMQSVNASTVEQGGGYLDIMEKNLEELMSALER